jgi:hypothetical protein
MGSFFPAQAKNPPNKFSQNPPNPKTNAAGMVPPRPGWQQLFDSHECSKCGGKHPEKYHDDPGIRDRWFKPSIIKSGAKHCAARSPAARNPRIQSGKERDFQRRVYQVFEVFVVDDDKEMLAHMAEMMEMEHVNITNGTEDDKPPREEIEEDTDVGNEEDASPAAAFAAMTLSSLLNYSAA